MMRAGIGVEVAGPGQAVLGLRWCTWGSGQQSQTQSMCNVTTVIDAANDTDFNSWLTANAD